MALVLEGMDGGNLASCSLFKMLPPINKQRHILFKKYPFKDIFKRLSHRALTHFENKNLDYVLVQSFSYAFCCSF